MCWCVTILRKEDRNRTHTQFALQHAQTMVSVRLPQTTNFCQQCRLNHRFSGGRANVRQWHKWLYHLFLNEYMFLSMLKMWRQWVDSGRVKEKRGEMVLAAPGGSCVWCFSMQLLPNTHTLPVGVCVCMCVYFLCIHLVSYFHIRNGKPVFFRQKSIFSKIFTGLVLILLN